MENLTKAQKKGIIQTVLDDLGVQGNYMGGSFFVKPTDVKGFEKDFMKSLPKASTTYLENNKLNPDIYNRSLTYSVSNEKNNFVINF